MMREKQDLIKIQDELIMQL